MAEHNQQFKDITEWVNKGRSWLTRRGSHVHAICFDMKRRPILCGGDFMRARDEDAFPVRWLWPNQVARMAMSYDFEIALKTDDPSLEEG